MFTTSLESCYNIARLRERAAKRMPAAMFHYIDGAAGDEWTMRQNTEAFDQYELVPRFLVDVSEIDLSTTVLGRRIDMPLFCAPTAMSRLFHHDGVGQVTLVLVPGLEQGDEEGLEGFFPLALGR